MMMVPTIMDPCFRLRLLLSLSYPSSIDRLGTPKTTAVSAWLKGRLCPSLYTAFYSVLFQLRHVSVIELFFLMFTFGGLEKSRSPNNDTHVGS